MSLAEKIGAIMQRPGQDVVPKDDVPWWMKYAGRGLGTVGSMVAIVLGVWSCVGIVFGDINCLISGMWQMIAGAVVIMIEAPCCCLFIDFVQNISDWVEKRPYWNRAAFYCIIALPSVFLCRELQSIFGSGLIFTTGVIYGLMSLGRKASQQEMMSNADRETDATVSAPSSGMHSILVDNAAPMSFTGTPNTVLGSGV
ncbi:calcium channel flower isoform X1 [Cryptotermes secundus]|nr:calcium channel flower isoform X1 [Cryptotermes secundus]XP_023701904.1 calcium channel flower isoform X1 [Cryptotermes secundus]